MVHDFWEFRKFSRISPILVNCEGFCVRSTIFGSTICFRSISFVQSTMCVQLCPMLIDIFGFSFFLFIFASLPPRVPTFQLEGRNPTELKSKKHLYLYFSRAPFPENRSQVFVHIGAKFWNRSQLFGLREGVLPHTSKILNRHISETVRATLLKFCVVNQITNWHLISQ